MAKESLPSEGNGTIDRGKVFPSSDKAKSAASECDQIVVVHEEALPDAFGRMGVYDGPIHEQNRLMQKYGTMLYEGEGLIVKYQGDWINGKWHGQGELLMTSGDKYQGDFCDSQREGEGVYTWSDERVYKGEFRKNARHGKGTYTWANGAVYHGDFKHNQRQGSGSYTDPDAGVKYVGDFVGGVYEGEGIYEWKNANGELRRYQGSFVKGKPHGKGTQLREDGSVVHKGEWRNGEPANPNFQLKPAPANPKTAVVSNQSWNDPHAVQASVYRGLWDVKHQCPVGNGTVEYGKKNGDCVRYEGCFAHGGRYHGKGRLTFRSGDVYEGDFEKGFRQGQGIYHWPDGRIYNGHFEQNVRSGPGTMTFANGDYYEGAFSKGKRHGQGRFLFHDGALYQGQWEDGLYHGQGTLVHSDGQTYTGEFAGGVAHGMGKEMKSDGKVVFDGEFVRGRRVEKGKPNDGYTQDEIFSAENDPGDSPPKQSVSPSPVKATPKVSLDTDPCDAVVDMPIKDGCGNTGRYTGLVLRSTKKPHGVGRLVYGDGHRIHEGFWSHGNKHGHGRCLFFPEGDFHEGEYVQNLRHGAGRYQWKDGRLFEGSYKDDARHGHGVFIYPTGEKYDGSFENGGRQGKGVFTFAGGQYSGGWKSGRYDGKGRLEWEDGKVYEGEFRRGKFNGHGRLTDNEDLVYEGDWIEGKRADESLDAGSNEQEPTDAYGSTSELSLHLEVEEDAADAVLDDDGSDAAPRREEDEKLPPMPSEPPPPPPSPVEEVHAQASSTETSDEKLESTQDPPVPMPSEASPSPPDSPSTPTSVKLNTSKLGPVPVSPEEADDSDKCKHSGETAVVLD